MKPTLRPTLKSTIYPPYWHWRHTLEWQLTAKHLWCPLRDVTIQIWTRTRHYSLQSLRCKDRMCEGMQHWDPNSIHLPLFWYLIIVSITAGRACLHFSEDYKGCPYGELGKDERDLCHSLMNHEQLSNGWLSNCWGIAWQCFKPHVAQEEGAI